MQPISIASAISLPIATRPALLAGGAAPDFALALTALLLPGTQAGETGDEAIDGDEVRQDLAATGKQLPVAVAEGDSEASDDDCDDGDPDPADIGYAWFAAAPLPVIAEPLGISLPRPIAPPRVPESGEPSPALQFPGQALIRSGFGVAPVPGRAAAPVAPETAPIVGEAAPAAIEAVLAPATAKPTPTPVAPVATSIELPLAAAKAAAPATAAPQVSDTPAPAASAPAPTRIELPPIAPRAAAPAVARLDSPAVPAPAQPVVQPRAEAVQPFAAAMAVIEAGAIVQPRRADPRDPAPAAIAALAPSGEAVWPHQVAAAPDAQQGALDMRRHEWMASMVEHIETLRDAARETGGTRETQLRLAPDTLGTVDVAIRHEGDRVHVRFTADSAAARQLLSEAQPRLAELAEARGLRLGQTSVEAGSAGAGQGGQPRPETQGFVPRAPASVAADAADPESDDRIA